MSETQTKSYRERMEDIGATLPKHVQKSLHKRLTELSTDRSIAVKVPVDVDVSCMWDEDNEPTLSFNEINECSEDMLDSASDDELKELGLSSIIELREQVQKEITEWNGEIKRLEKAYSLEEDRLMGFFMGGYYEDN